MRRSRSGEGCGGGEAEGKASHRPRGRDKVGTFGEEIARRVWLESGEQRGVGEWQRRRRVVGLVQGQERGSIQRRERI